MPSNIISNMTAALAGAGNFDVIPPVGEAYLIKGFGSDAAFLSDVPDVQVSIRDGVLADAIVVLDPVTLPSKGTRPLELYITHDNYMRLKNTAGGNANVSWFGEKVNPVNVRVDLVAHAGGATHTIQPPAGETWKISEIGYSAWAAGGPNCQVGLTSAGGLVASMFQTGINHKGREKHPDLYINNTIYLRVTDLVGGGGGVFGYSGIRVNKTAKSSVQDVVGSGTLDIRPASDTEEWTITDIGAETWAGAGAPNNYPDIMVSMRVGANLSEILEAGSVDTVLLWNHDMIIDIDYNHYLRVTEISTGNNEVCISGFLKRQYS